MQQQQQPASQAPVAPQQQPRPMASSPDSSIAAELEKLRAEKAALEKQNHELKETNDMSFRAFTDKVQTDFGVRLSSADIKKMRREWETDRPGMIKEYNEARSRRTETAVTASKHSDKEEKPEKGASMAWFKTRLNASTYGKAETRHDAKRREKQQQQAENASTNIVYANRGGRRKPVMTYPEGFKIIKASALVQQVTGFENFAVHPFAWAHTREARLKSNGTCPQFGAVAFPLPGEQMPI
jgi:cell division protein FtsB